MKLFFICIAILAPALSTGSYLPPAIWGEPLSMTVVSLDPPDIRNAPVYRINFQVRTEEGEIVDGLIHRTFAEFQKLDDKLDKSLLTEGAALELPASEGEATIADLDEYVKTVAANPEWLATFLVQDFMGINWDGQDIQFLVNLEGFLTMLTQDRLPEFCPEPPVIDEADVLAPETPFEVYIYFLAFRHDKEFTQEYLDFFEEYTKVTPTFAGPEVDSALAVPGASAPVEIPYHYRKTAVHFLPGGYLNGQTVRLSYLGKTKFSFLDEDLLREWFVKLHGDKKPKRIMDLGTGNCFSAFVLAELFPEAEVVAVDLAAPYIRFCRQWKEIRGATNVQFYQANGEDLSAFEENSFDFISYAYVLHEMPAVQAMQVVDEMVRILKPGATLNGFEVPYYSNPIVSEAYCLFNTWGFKWDTDGNHGPEPYMQEYEFGFKLPEYYGEIGLNNTEIIPYSVFESVFLATKPE